MRVVMITNPVFPDKVGGLERYVRSLSDTLSEEGVNVLIVSKAVNPDDCPIERLASGVVVRRYFPPSKRDPMFGAKYVPSVKKQVRRIVAEEYRVDSKNTVVHGHFAVPTSCLASAGIPYVYTFHAPSYRELLSERRGSYFLPSLLDRAAVASLKRLESRVVGNAVRVYTLSNFMYREALEIAPSIRDKHLQIPGGLDTARFKPAASVAVDLSGPPKVFAARRLVERTGVDILIRAMREVRLTHPDATLEVAGEGLMRESLEALIRDLGLQNSVALLGHVSDSELVRKYQQATVSVTPTRALEGFGLSTAEALACGCPAVVTPVGANPEVVEGLDGRLIASSSAPRDLAEAICGVIDGSMFGLEFREGAAAFASARFGWQAVAEAQIKSYEEVLGERSLRD